MTDSQIDVADNSIHKTLNTRVITPDLYDTYIECYIETLNKTESFRRAVALSDNKDIDLRHATTYAHRLHAKLLDRIQTRLKQLSIDDQVSSRNLLNEFKADPQAGYAVRSKIALEQTKRLYNDDSQASSGITVNVNRDNVSITHKNQTLTIESTD